MEFVRFILSSMLYIASYKGTLSCGIVPNSYWGLVGNKLIREYNPDIIPMSNLFYDSLLSPSKSLLLDILLVCKQACPRDPWMPRGSIKAISSKHRAQGFPQRCPSKDKRVPTFMPE